MVLAWRSNAGKRMARAFTPVKRVGLASCCSVPLATESGPGARFAVVLLFLAGFWGFVAGSALLLGAAFGYFARVPQRAIAGIIAFGGGVLISALSFDLMDEAYKRGGFDSTAIGFVAGSVGYTLAHLYPSPRGAQKRQRSGRQEASEDEDNGSRPAPSACAPPRRPP